MPTKPINAIQSNNIVWKVDPPFAFNPPSYSTQAVSTILEETPNYFQTEWGIIKSDTQQRVGLFLVGMIDGIRTKYCAPPCPPYCTQNDEF